MRFSEFGLAPALLKNIEAAGYHEATSIQDEILPIALEGKDVSGLSKTGTGKTAAFLIPSIHRLLNGEPEKIILCIAPTRELAIQIEAEAKRLTTNMGLGTVSVIGGMSSADQMTALSQGARIVVGTPGRLIDLYKEKALDLSRVSILVFDEADRMFDMGFIKDMRYLLSKIPETRQILLFSATLNFSVLHLIYEFGSAPQEVNVSRDQMTADGIQQVIYQVADNEKAKAMIAVCKRFATEEGAIIVFTNYKERVPTIVAALTANGYPAQGLSSLMRQDKRNRIIQGFRTGKFRALVATDVASRGLDIDNVCLVVNFHLPEDAATYVHRIGRTARAGKSGIAVSIASSEDAYNQIRVEEFLGKKIPVEWLGEADLNFEMKWPDRIYSEEEEEGGDAAPRSHEARGGREQSRHPRDRGGRHAGPGRRDGREERPRRPHHDRDASQEARPERRPADAPVVIPRARADGEVAPIIVAPTERANNRPARHERSARPERGTRDNRRPPIVAPADMPSPITGNPVIYCTRTGKPKNRSAAEMARLIEASRPRNDNKSPALLKKIRSRVSALFTAKK